MRAIVLAGAVALRDLAVRVQAELSPVLAARGYEVAVVDLAALDVPPCRGDFGCWTVTPGVCVQAGPHRDVARELVQSDLAVLLTPVTFGGYSSCLKRHVDHWIPLSTPWFTTIAGETHHVARYERMPSLLAVGLLERPDPAAAAVFDRLVHRNAVNLHAPHVACAFMTPGAAPQAGALAGVWLDALERSPAPAVHAEPLDVSAASGAPTLIPRRALLVVGSPRGKASASAALAGRLGDQLRGHGVSVATEYVHAHLRHDPGLERLGAAIRDADLVALASPLYVDALPGPVVALLERIAQRPAAPGAQRPRFVAVVNSGFPEAVHADTALAISKLFASAAGLVWAGGLAVGAGGMLAGRPLAEQGRRARHARRALDLTAEALARGDAVPDEARREAATLSIPRWMYRALGRWGFRRDGKARGTLGAMDDRPYSR